MFCPLDLCPISFLAISAFLGRGTASYTYSYPCSCYVFLTLVRDEEPWKMADGPWMYLNCLRLCITSVTWELQIHTGEITWSYADHASRETVLLSVLLRPACCCMTITKKKSINMLWCCSSWEKPRVKLQGHLAVTEHLVVFSVCKVICGTYWWSMG